MSSSDVQALSDLIASGNFSDGVFRELVEVLPVAIYATDADGRLTYFNQAAEKLSGCVLQLGTNQWFAGWKIFLPDGTCLPNDQSPMALALKGSEAGKCIECEAERPDGTRFWFSSSSAALRDAQGRITGGIHLLTDLSDRKKAGLDTDAEFRAIVETTPDCVKIISRDGTLLFMNPQGLRMVGASRPEEVVGKSVYDLIAPKDRQRFREMHLRICGGEKASMEFDLVGLNGVHRLMETHAVPLSYSDGTVVHLGITRDITERRRSEHDISLLAAIVGSSDDAIISKDLHGVITSWNKSAQRVFGYTAEEAIGKTVAELLIPDDRQDEEPKILDRLRRGERVDHFETVRRRKDGSLLDLSLTISPVRDARGQIIGASKIARDISERTRAEQAIHTLNMQLTTDLSAVTRLQQISTRMMQVEDFPQLLDEILAAAIEITSADMGNVQLLEDGVLKIVVQRGFTPPFLDYFNSLQGGPSACDQAIKQGNRVIVEDVSSSPIFAGTPALAVMLGAGALAVQSTPLISRSRQLVGVLSTHYRVRHRPADRDLRLLDILARQTADLIERKRAEGQLERSRRTFFELVERAPFGIYVVDSNFRIVQMNTGSQNNAFRNVRPVIGRDLREAMHILWPPVVAEDIIAAFRHTLVTGEPYSSPQFTNPRLDTATLESYEWELHRMVLPDGQFGVICYYFDSTELRSVEAALRNANYDLEQFAFSASHDLQEPIRSVKIYSELLADRLGDSLSADARKYMSFLRSGATRMETLVRDLLAYTRVTSFEAPPGVADAKRALEVALSNLSGAISETAAQVTAGPLPQVGVHETHLQQLFQNLVGNAIKYRSPERHPLVRVTAERRDGYCTFTVIDNGIGIHPDYKETIFGLFKRLHNTNDYSGTGIGLAICKRIVDRYHGRIWVESEPGQGSTFRFTLPA